MQEQADSRIQLTVDLCALRKNYRTITRAVSPCSVLPVVKANAYGLGVHKVADALACEGASLFGVATLQEALEISQTSRTTLILGTILPSEIEEAIATGVTITIADEEMAKAVSREATRQKRRANCHFLIDTGMGRIGILLGKAEEVIAGSFHLPSVHSLDRPDPPDPLRSSL